MIKKIIIENFFSFQKVTEIPLNKGVNLLLGINGSGKSNLLRAIALLKEGVSVKGGFENLFQQAWGGFYQVANAGNPEIDKIKIDYIFDKEYLNSLHEAAKFHSDPIYSISICRLAESGYYLEESLHCLSRKENKKPFYYLQIRNGIGFVSERISDKKGQNITYKQDEFSGQELILSQLSDPMRFLPMYVIRKAIENITVYDYFNTTSGSKLRRPSEYSTQTILHKTGENLPQLLNRLKNHHISAYSRIRDEFVKINPNFIGIELEPVRESIYLMLREKGLDKTISVSHISDGTLRFLIYLTILYNPKQTGLACLDEPENGLHPDMINTIATAMKEYAKHNQLIVATHSPLLLNNFDVDDLIIFEKSCDNESCVKKILSDEFDDYEGELLPGVLWLSGLLGGTRW